MLDYESEYYEEIERRAKALTFIAENGIYEGGHHKQWVLDQVVRILTGSGYDYEDWLMQFHEPELWETGSAP
jgi:hypothetical protein